MHPVRDSSLRLETETGEQLISSLVWAAHAYYHAHYPQAEPKITFTLVIVTSLEQSLSYSGLVFHS